jgi:hypothetical protein
VGNHKNGSIDRPEILSCNGLGFPLSERLIFCAVASTQSIAGVHSGSATPFQGRWLALGRASREGDGARLARRGVQSNCRTWTEWRKEVIPDQHSKAVLFPCHNERGVPWPRPRVNTGLAQFEVSTM